MFLPSNEFNFHFRSVGEKTKHVYEGGFKVKCLLTAAEQVDVAIRADQYSRGAQSLGPTAKLLANTIANLEVRIIEAPSWWKDSGQGRNLLDNNVIFELFNKALDGEAEFEKRIEDAKKEADESIERSAKREKEKAAKKNGQASE